MTEIAIYGILCSICSFAAIFSDPRNLAYSLLCTFTISLFWAGNVLLWSLNAIEYYVFIDVVFAVASFALAKVSGLRWVAILGICYTGNVLLDVAYINGTLEYHAFAWLSNILFICELFIASHRGWLRIIQGELDPWKQ